MSKRYKKKRATPLTKLLIFLLFATPIFYLGISYAMGQDGIGNIKSLVGLNKKTDNEVKSYVPDNNITAEERDQIYQQIEDMKRQLREKNQTIQRLEGEITTLQAANNQ